MKALQLPSIILILIFTNASWIFSQGLNQILIRENGQKDLIGLCKRTALDQAPFQEWFEINYEKYQLTPDLMEKFDRNWEGISLDIFMGTWCGDSKREVPRFYKILDELDFPEENLRLVNVDKTPKAYKQSPTHEERGKLIHRVPTFIIYKEGKEIGRIVESPVTSLEMDFLQILKGFPSSPNYRIVSRLDAYFEDYGIPKEDQQLLELARSLYKDVCSDKALNTYGYYLMYKGEIEKAIASFKINTMFFRDIPNVFDSLAEAYLMKGEKEKALAMYEKVLSMDGENENALKQVVALKKRSEERIASDIYRMFFLDKLRFAQKNILHEYYRQS